MLHKVIIADNQSIFRMGIAKVLSMEDDFRIIAQCLDAERLEHALGTFGAATVLFSSTLKLDINQLMQRICSCDSRGIAMLEISESPQPFLAAHVHGLFFRSITAPAVVECVRRVDRGERVIHDASTAAATPDEDIVGARARDRLAPKEMKVIALIVQGCKNKEIALRLNTTEQVIKNYLGLIFDKLNVADRLELALFTIHHHALAEAVAGAGKQISEALSVS